TSSLLDISCFVAFASCPTAVAFALSLHDALPILGTRTFSARRLRAAPFRRHGALRTRRLAPWRAPRLGHLDLQLRARRGEELPRSEEHTSGLQSRENLVCRPLLERKKADGST